jgi:hypothetical protein
MSGSGVFLPVIVSLSVTYAALVAAAAMDQPYREQMDGAAGSSAASYEPLPTASAALPYPPPTSFFIAHILWARGVEWIAAVDQDEFASYQEAEAAARARYDESEYWIVQAVSLRCAVLQLLPRSAPEHIECLIERDESTPEGTGP